MQFSHPEVLYALFLLIIPLLVHLFQLRKFRRENFTNVKFLKRLTDQTRKSSRLKKWLVLTTRILLLAAIIFAFAQPYFPTTGTAGNLDDLETVIYLDNSYSMQAQGQRGRLLERSVQELLENFPEEGNITLITNTDEYSPVTRNDLQQIEYAAPQPDLQTILLRANNRFSKNDKKNKNLFLISDFQERFHSEFVDIPTDLNVYALALRPERMENVQIDTAYISRTGLDNQVLHIQIGYSGNNNINVPVSLYNGEKLLGKSSVDFSERASRSLEFPLEEQNIPQGIITIEDSGLRFDNSLFFSLNTVDPIRVVSINAAPDDFLNRIYTAPEFEYKAMDGGSIDYNSLSASQVTILNQLSELSPSLLNNLQEKIKDENIFIVIPSPEEIGNNFRTFLKEIGFNPTNNKQEREKLITEISYEHPLFAEVFEEKTPNFEYPRVQLSYDMSMNTVPVLAYQDQQAFLTENNGDFLFTAPLDKENSNFQLSPLVVPTFYNMGISAIRPPNLYYNLDRMNRIEVPATIQDDNILQIATEDMAFIPRQQSSANKVTITLDELPGKPGNYQILKNNEPLMSLSFNIPSAESNLSYLNISENKNIQEVSNISGFFTTAGFNKEEGTIWKWFVTFALILLIIETLLLKYLK